MAKSEMLVRLKAETNDYDRNIAKAKRTLDDFKQSNLTLGGILSNTAKSLTAAAAGFMSISAAASAIKGVVEESIELAKAGEGIRIAFERLNQPGLLDNLREATHGTVTNLELMKAAVKFNDFKLPVEELGTMLAFAQQKAKDTGQSIDYMVDSIVTGLGRKSLMILDNLGLSANEIKEKMKETGDMTKAVGEIIREQMGSAGEYVRTAADEAAAAEVRMKNEMEELGKTISPLTSAARDLSTELKVGILQTINELAPAVVDLHREISSLTEGFAGVGSVITTVFDRAIESVKTKIQILAASVSILNNLLGNTRGGAGADAGAALSAAIGTTGASTPTPSPSDGGAGKGGGASKKLIEGGIKAARGFEELAAGTINTYESMASLRERLNRYQKALDNATNAIDEMTARQGIAATKWAMSDTGRQAAKLGLDQSGFEALSKNMGSALGNIEGLNFDKVDTLSKAGLDTAESWKYAATAIQTVGQALNAIENPAAQIAATVAQAIATIALAYSETLAKDKTSKSNIFAFIAAAASATVSMATTIAAIHKQTGYASGGIVPGNDYSDNTLVRVSSGELILNRAQQNSLASQLAGDGGGRNATTITPYVSGEQIYLGLSNYLRRSGHGELVTSR